MHFKIEGSKKSRTINKIPGKTLFFLRYSPLPPPPPIAINTKRMYVLRQGGVVRTMNNSNIRIYKIIHYLVG
jgi:hypothetical protein